MSYWTNRTWCDCIEEMRQAYKTYNFGAILGLIEELQSFGSRMEAGLGNKKDLIKMQKDWSKKKAKLKELDELIKEKKKILGIKKKKKQSISDQINGDDDE